MANNLPINRNGRSQKQKNKANILKKVKKIAKKTVKNIYIIIKALSVLSLRGIKKIKASLIKFVEMIKKAKLGKKFRKAAMFFVKILILIYCLFAEGILWLSRILGTKIQKNRILNNLILRIKGILHKKIEFKFLNSLLLNIKKLSSNINIIVFKRAKPLKQDKSYEINDSIVTKTEISFVLSLKHMAKKTVLSHTKLLAHFREKAKIFFKDPRQNTKVLIKRIKTFNKQRNNILVPISVVSVCLIVGIYMLSFYTIGLNVYSGKDIVARASTQHNFEVFINDFDTKLSKQLGEPYETKMSFYYEFSLVPKSELDNFDRFEVQMIKNNHEIQQMYVIKADDKVVAANLDEEKIKQALENYKLRYSSGVEGEKLEFVEDVKVVKQFCKSENYKSISEIEALLISSRSKAVADHIVQKGETLSEIAWNYNMRTSELLELNSNISEKRLQIGTALAVSKDKPVISIRTIKPMIYNQAVAYGTQTESDSSMYKNQTKVKSAGVLGEETVKANVVLIDGEEVDRVIFDRQTTIQPIDQVLLKGTKALPSTAPTGSLRTPVSGYISSRFGYRGAGEYHTGLDIAAPTGTPVYAADGGRVIFAGWSGSYGYLIKLDHGSGMQTWYAHLSKINVSVGTSVSKGSKIGAVGSTGRSTGSHLHIEVRKYGTAVNPQNYLH